MDRRRFLGETVTGLLGLGLLTASGCRSRQTAQVLKPGEQDMVGSHSAGGETYKPLVGEAVAKLLGRHSRPMQASFNGEPGPMRICFVGVENKSVEELGDFKEQIYQMIDAKLLEGGSFHAVSRRYVEAGLRETRMRPDQLMIPQNMRTFAASMEQMGQPFDYLLYATINSGTTHSNKDYQRDYTLTLEMIDVRTGQYDKQQATLSKGYNVSPMAKIKNFKLF
ncbi:MAG: penicillin-binding protein activator LpoB [Thermoguttaceae bacterium]